MQSRLAAAVVLLLALLLQACSTTKTAPPPAQKEAGSSSPSSSRLTQRQASDATVYALGLIGTPYKWGGNTPQSGFDCSGLIAYVFNKAAGLVSPRTVAQLTAWGQTVPTPEARTGDLVVFGHHHAGIYVGEGRFVHAPSTGGTVRVDSLKSRYWATQVATFRRP